MDRAAQLYEAAKRNPRGVRFDELCKLAELFGFEFDRQKGSHRIYKKDGYPDLLNFQEAQNGMAYAYQVRQVLRVIDAIPTADEG